MIETGGNYLIGQGVLGVVLLVLAIAIWRIILWGKTKVVEPMVQSHIDLIRTLNEHIPKQTESISSQTGILTKIADQQDAIIHAREIPKKSSL